MALNKTKNAPSFEEAIFCLFHKVNFDLEISFSLVRLIVSGGGGTTLSPYKVLGRAIMAHRTSAAPSSSQHFCHVNVSLCDARQIGFTVLAPPLE